jgi:transcriptional regulator with XRE-family HTH domain
MASYGSQLVREARRRAGLTQVELAERAGTGQPTVARWESGRTAISVDDVVRLVRLCGLDVEFHLVERDTSDLVQADRLAGLSAQGRLERLGRVTAQMATLRAAGGGRR